ncbi:2-oxoglutarate dehydrogenase subunit E2 [Flavobacterium psychrophilum]|nr:2-oxoglutarate dehydrogenase subunit E2 [Flavobacterium psychrophilum]
MILEMKVPSPGESIKEVEIATWLVKDGDYVEKDQAIAEVDSDKATLELPAEASGIITLKAEEGDAVAVGAVVCHIDTDGEKPSGSAPVAEAPKAEVKVEAPKVAPVAQKNLCCTNTFPCCKKDIRRKKHTTIRCCRNRKRRKNYYRRCCKCSAFYGNANWWISWFGTHKTIYVAP